MRRRRRYQAGRIALGGVLASLLAAASARADETRFAVVDLAPAPQNEKLLAAVEAEVARLRPGARPMEDPVMRRLLATSEGPAAAASRLLHDAVALRKADDCEGAMTKGRQAETVILNALSLDEEREPLKTLYSLMVICAHQRGQMGEIVTAAARLRALVSLPPSDFPQDLWATFVANAVPGQPRTELQVDSDPPNAQVSINFHGDGVTPRTLKVAPGLVYVEVQKEGFKKAFRAVEVKERPIRTVLRLIARTHDRVEQAEAQLRVARHGELKEHVRTLSMLSQLARVETLVLVSAAEGKVRIWFFDAERGALTETAIESTYDPESGSVAELAGRPAPRAFATPPPVPAAAPSAPAAETAAPPPKEAEATPAATAEEGLPEAKAQQQQAQFRPRPKKQGPPWWSWAIAGVVVVAFGAFVYGDRARQSDTIRVRAHWSGQ